jgi:mRNA-degrading endonuclease toxin of MazEF toxin-antitoxin module
VGRQDRCQSAQVLTKHSAPTIWPLAKTKGDRLVVVWYNPASTRSMKTAISLPDDLFRQAEALARKRECRAVSCTPRHYRSLSFWIAGGRVILRNASIQSILRNLPRHSVVNVSQLLTLDRSFLCEHVGTLSEKLQAGVDHGLRLVLDLGWHDSVTRRNRSAEILDCASPLPDYECARYSLLYAYLSAQLGGSLPVPV